MIAIILMTFATKHSLAWVNPQSQRCLGPIERLVESKDGTLSVDGVTFSERAVPGFYCVVRMKF